MLGLMFELIARSPALPSARSRLVLSEQTASRIGQAFIAIDPAALAGTENSPSASGFVVIDAFDEVRLPGARRFASERASQAGIEVPDDLLAQIEKLCST